MPTSVRAILAALLLVASSVAMAACEPGGFHVWTRAALKPRTKDELAAAKYFDGFGTNRLHAGDSVIIPNEGGSVPFPPNAHRPTYEEFVDNLVCRADRVVVGRVESGKPLLNLRETWLFTDYQVVVEDSLRPQSDLSRLVVSDADGSVVIGVLPTDTHFSPITSLRVGHRYFLFSRRIPGADALFAAGHLEIAENGKVDGTTWHSAPPGFAARVENLESFRQDLKTSARTCPS